MPTFQSIPIHPSVLNRFLHPTADNDDTEHQNQRYQQQIPRSSISTPRSLLIRDPHDLVEVFSRGDIRNEEDRFSILARMEHIRSQVAHAMIAKTRNGKRVRNHQSYHQRGSLVQGGSLSALHVWKLQQESLSTGPHVYSTGCRALDDLVAFPIEYFLCAPGFHYNVHSRESLGIPRGYVLQVSGTIGKTQLALQLAVQVIQQSKAEKGHRVRYCYSTAGHSGYSLAQRFSQLLGNSNQQICEDMTKKIEFQPIASVSQLVKTLAKLEEDWLLHASESPSSSVRWEEQQQQNETRKKGQVAMLVLDSLPFMLVERDDIGQQQTIERWLKRLARHHSMLIVTTGGFSNNNTSPDIHLQLRKLSPTTSSVRLIRHPARLANEKDSITVLHSCKFGMTTPE